MGPEKFSVPVRCGVRRARRARVGVGGGGPRQQPPQPVGESVRLLYASQIGTAPPRFAIVSNRPEAIPEAYTRYLVNGFRDAWRFTGSPLNLKLRRRRGAGRRGNAPGLHSCS